VGGYAVDGCTVRGCAVDCCAVYGCTLGCCAMESCAVGGGAVDGCTVSDCFMADHAVGGCTLCGWLCCERLYCTLGRYPGNRSLFWKPETRVNYFVQIICSVV